MSKSMAAFVKWLAANYEDGVRRFRQDVVRRREQYRDSGAHLRTPTILANLAAGWELFLQFALESKALTREEVEKLQRRGAAALEAAAASQGQHLAANDPVDRFVALLSSAIASGRAPGQCEWRQPRRTAGVGLAAGRQSKCLETTG